MKWIRLNIRTERYKARYGKKQRECKGKQTTDYQRLMHNLPIRLQNNFHNCTIIDFFPW